MELLLFLVKNIVGLTHQVKGAEHLQAALKLGPCLVACKHQSAWETIALGTFFDSFTIVLKSELRKVPLFGLYLKKSNMIFIDRQAGRQSIKTLLTQARQAVQQNQSILIFPEGTRTSPGVPGTYQPGVGLLYSDLNIPVLPVALNSGLLWGRRSWIKRSGQVTIEFLPPILPGLKREEFMARLKNDIESACEKLI
ncbi:lysophospholipid acyltransferase family protein [Candidatus Finniella inopinata]|nr:lysophospholipid acyltransferase family protein [Candidatus Finniella inopinata]